MPRLAINGMGRIGRAALKVLLQQEDVEVVAVNDIVPLENLAYLLRYDTVYGRSDRDVEVRDDSLVIDGRTIRVLSQRDPADLPWRELEVDLVLECTGLFTREEDLAKHVAAGAPLVVLSAPTRSASVPTIVHGVNSADGGVQLRSCASCTTNCIAPVLEIAERRLSVRRAIMTTVHAYTATQALIDGPGSRNDFLRGRAAAMNLIPASTGAAVAATRAVPGLAGSFDGIAVRVPVPVGSISDIVFVTGRPTSADEVNAIFEDEAATPRYAGILRASREPLVSSDIIGDPHAAIVDLPLTMVVDTTLVKVMAWYDNEWGFTHQMVREARTALGLADARPGAHR